MRSVVQITLKGRNDFEDIKGLEQYGLSVSRNRKVITAFAEDIESLPDNLGLWYPVHELKSSLKNGNYIMM